MSASLSANSFSAARGAAIIPTKTPQIGDTEEMLLAKMLATLQSAANLSLVAVTTSLADVTSNGTIAAGFSSIRIANVGSANATITTPSGAAVTLTPTQAPLDFVAPNGGKLPAIDYTASATAILRIIKTGATA